MGLRSMSQLFRAMREATDGLPIVEQSSRGLGVRPGIDIAAIDGAELVFPGDGGPSVAPDDPRNLPRHRRPAEFGGTGKDPVWSIDEDDLGALLVFRVDPDNPKHGYIEPARPLNVDSMQQALKSTRPNWRKVQRGTAEETNDLE
jgi:hypothetical protein